MKKNVEYYGTTMVTEPYLSLTVHFVNDNFELKSLLAAYFPTDHTEENIALELRESLSTCGLKEEDQTCITTNNASKVYLWNLMNGPDFSDLDTGCILQLVSICVYFFIEI